MKLRTWMSSVFVPGQRLAGVLLAGVVLAGPLPGLSFVAAAQEPAEGALVLRAAHLFDGRSGTLQSPGVLVVRGERIVGVGPEAAVPAGARVVDLGDATLLPGFIDAHTHVTGDYSTDWARAEYAGMRRFPAEDALHAARNARVTLEAGFTTVRDVGAGDFIDVSLRNAIRDGVAEGPRMLVSGHAIGSTGGHCDGAAFPPDLIAPSGPLEGVCNGADECRLATRLQMKYGADNIKICASGGVLSETDPVDVPQLTPAELEAIISEAHNWGRKVAAHAHGDRAALMAIEAGVDSIEHGTFLKPATLERMKRDGVFLVPTRVAVLQVVQDADGFPPQVAAKARSVGSAHEAMFRNALRIGVPIALGTDSAVYPHGLNAREFGDYVALGMPPADALMTSSQGAARLLGVDGETGTLEAGKYADVVAVPGDVLQDIRATERPVFVMKQGRIVVDRP